MLQISQQIAKMHELPQILVELQEFWKNEQNRRNEFYDWVTPDMKVEFIEGEIVVHSPVRRKHNAITSDLAELLRVYTRQTVKGFVGVEKIMCRFTRNDYEPNICYFDAAQDAEISDEQTIFPVPRFIIEITSTSTEYRDRGVKLKDFEAHGVLEYWIIDPNLEQIEQYILIENKYELQGVFSTGTIQSQAITDLQLPVRAIFDKAVFAKTIADFYNFK